MTRTRIDGLNCLRIYLQRILENTRCNLYSSPRYKFLLGWLPVLFYCSLIFFLSSRKIEIKINLPWWDKYIHFIEYGVLALLLFHAFLISGFTKLRKIALFSFSLATFYGLSDELHQYFVPGRDCSPLDFLFDLTGAGIVSLVLCKSLR